MAQAYCPEGNAGHQELAQHSERRAYTVRTRVSEQEAFWHSDWICRERGQKCHGRRTMQSYTENNGFTESMQNFKGHVTVYQVEFCLSPKPHPRSGQAHS